MNGSFEYSNKVWKEKPPGPEQLLLDDMFTNGSITVYATPEQVRQSCELFKEFTPKVFSAHFRKTKARFGEFLVTARGIPGGVIPPDKADISAAKGCIIPELGSTVPPTKRARASKPESAVDIINPPHTTWTYTDHDSKNDYVCIAISIFSGSKSINFDIAEDGMSVTAKFTWPNVMHNAAEMFGQVIKQKRYSMHHPMIHSMVTHLLETGITEQSKPEGQWVIPLPCRVRREVTSYEMMKITNQNSNVLFVRFTAYQNDLIIEQANRTITFD